MVIWLDDTFKPKNSDNLWVKTASECIEWLKMGECTTLYLDHDLGLPDETGYDVILWLEKTLVKTENANIIPDEIVITTFNTSAQKKMFNGAMKIKQLCTALNKDVEVSFHRKDNI